MRRSTSALCGLVVLSSVAFAGVAAAERPGADGFFQTGVFVRKDASGPVLSIVHEVKTLPATRTASALVDASVEKRFLIAPLRDIPCTEFRAKLESGFARNGLTTASAEAFASACPGTQTLKARSRVTLSYSPTTQTTTLSIEKLGTTTLSGVPAMKKIWGAWLSVPETPAEKNALSDRM